MPLSEVLLNDVVHPASHNILSLTNPETFLHRWPHPSLAKLAPVFLGEKSGSKWALQEEFVFL